MRSSPYELRTSTSATHYRSSTPRRSAKMARDRLHHFLESGAENSELSEAENQQPNNSADRKYSRRDRLVIQSDEGSDTGGGNNEMVNEKTLYAPPRNHDIFGLQSSRTSRHFPKQSDQGSNSNDYRRHSDRLSQKSFRKERHFYLDELEASEEEDGHADMKRESMLSEYEYEERGLSAYKRYNLRDRKRPERRARSNRDSEERRSVRYNLRPQRGSRASNEYQIPWSVAEQYLLPEKSKRRIPDKALMEVTPELQPFESQMDINSGHVDDNTSTLGCDDITAQTIQPSSSTEHPFSRIAGMSDYVKQLKEMVVFPLLYPSLFNRLGISPPRGVLFHGPPGTGKTLMARLLAESCSTATKKVSFFMRNGSDCLSKWIGEAERNMKLLFQKAKECQPSIIFFDEIDGLAPERSARADQSHISLVSTMLALMDGLDDRGNVVVIGATNRINALDPALRRPGRFDREFYFGLPDDLTRLNVLQILTKTWSPVPDNELLVNISKATHGFSGADLKGLCTESALYAIRRIAPEAYDNISIVPVEATFLERPIHVLKQDFYQAFQKIVPSTRRQDSVEQPTIALPYSILFSDILKCMTECILDVLGTPIPALPEQSLYGQSSWILKRNFVNFQCSLPYYLSSRLLKVASSQIPGFRAVWLNYEKLTNDSPIKSQLFSGPFREVKMHSPSILVVPDLEHCSYAKEISDALLDFSDSLFSSEPCLIIGINTDFSIVDHLPFPSVSQLISYAQHVLASEVKSIVFDKLSSLETIVEYGRLVGVDLENLLLSPFPDYPAFEASLTILLNQEEIVAAIQTLLPLSTEDWYLQFVPAIYESHCSKDVNWFASLHDLRVDLLRHVQMVRVPTEDSLASLLRNKQIVY